MNKNPLHFIHISDTHVGPTKTFQLRDVLPFETAQQTIEAIRSLPFKPAFVIHTGDVAADPDENSYRLVQELFATLDLPVRYVTGNHDDSRLLRKILPSQSIDKLNEDPTLLSYAFTSEEHRFVTLDARISDPFWSGKLSDNQFDFLDSEISLNPKSLTIFLHYPSLSLNVPWIDQKMMLVNGERLHQKLRALPAGTVRGVFSGHVHRGISVLRDGILYQSGPSTASQFVTWPNTPDITFAKSPVPSFHLITYVNGTTIVQPHNI